MKKDNSKEFETTFVETCVSALWQYWTDHNDADTSREQAISKYRDKVTQAHHKASQELVRGTLERLKAEHADTCGATYPDIPRDNCKYEDIVKNELLRELKPCGVCGQVSHHCMCDQALMWVERKGQGRIKTLRRQSERS